MDNRMLDVAIGLALVFALTSLLASVLTEMLLSKQEKRGKNLLLAVSSMLGDDDGLARKLYQLPVMRTLYLGERLPSYLEPDLFCGALFELLGQQSHLPLARGQGTPQEFVSALRTANPLPAGQSGPATGLAAVAVTLQSLAAGVESDWPAFEARVQKWFEATAARSTGWYTRSAQSNLFVVGLLLAVVLNINPIVIGSTLWRDPVLREAMVESARTVVAERAATTSVAPSAPAAATGGEKAATQPPQAAAESFTDKQIDGFLAALEHDRRAASLRNPLLVSASRMRQEIAHERSLRAIPNHQEAALAALAGSNDARLATLDDELQSFVQASGRSLDPGLAKLAETRLQGIRHGLANERHVVGAKPAAASAKPRNERQTCPQVAGVDPKKDTGEWAFGRLCSLGIPLGWGESPLESLADTPYPDSRWLNVGVMILGFVITAAACTLGAQFWFDLLNRLVKLRGAGGKPAEQPAGSGAGSAAAAAAKAAAPATPGSVVPFRAALNDFEAGLVPEQVQRVQRALQMPNARISGVLDGATRAAIQTWHERRGEGSSNQLTAGDFAVLLPSVLPTHAGSGHPEADEEADVCGCDVECLDETLDEQLPAADGGVS
jgi:hypothetical protein